MNRRPLCVAAVVFVLGSLYAQTGLTAIRFLFVAVFLEHILFVFFKRGKKAGIVRILFLVFSVMAGYLHTESEIAFRERVLCTVRDKEETQIQGTVCKQEIKNETHRIYLKECYLQRGQSVLPCNQILVYLDADDISVGDTILVNGTIKQLESTRNKGNFDEKQFYQSQKIDFKFYGDEVQILGNSNTVYENWILKQKSRIKEVYENNTDQKTAGLLQTMLLGERGFLDEEVKSLYQKAGLSHILAISGLHISLIGMSVYRMFKRLGMHLSVSAIMSGVFVLAFGFLTGNAPQVQRAVLMFLILMFGTVIGRSYDLMSALSVCAIFLLWDNPFLVGYAGFLLSFLAVMGIGIVASVFEGDQRQEKWKNKVCGNLAIQLATLPVLAYFYYEVPLYAMILNLLLLPSVGVLLSVGLIGGMVGLLSEHISKILLKLCSVFFFGYEKSCKFFLSLPGAVQIIGQPSKKGVICYYVILAVVCAGAAGWNRLGQRKEYVEGETGNQRGKTVWILLGSVVLVISLALCSGEKQQFQVQVLDVGQGDGIFIQSGEGTNFFVDGGSTDVKQVGTYRILPSLKAMGIQKIDVWFISHCDEDHMNGCLEILESGYPVDMLVFSAYVTEDKNYQELVGAAKEQGCEIRYLKEGEQIKTDTLQFTQCAKKSMAKPGDKNAASMVLLLETEDFRGILTGDIGKEEEKQLALGEVTWYKAAHHGSKESNSEEFLETLHPKVATISCGIRNRYGHPGKEAVLHMKNSGAKIYDTRECGQIGIYGGDTVQVQCFLQR